MKHLSLIVAAVALLASTGIAQAAGTGVTASTETNWTGFYAGIFTGSGIGTITASGIGVEHAPGAIYGAQLGADLQIGTVVVGIQTEYTKSGMATGETPPDTIDWLASTTARVGIALANTLPYFKAGVAYGSGTGSDHSVSATGTANGWIGGAGLEVALTKNLSFFGEYDIYNLGPTTLDFGGPTIDVTLSASVAKAGLNARF